MERGEHQVSVELQECSEAVPSLLKMISSNEVAGFDNVRRSETSIFPEPMNIPESSGHQRKLSISISMPSSPTRGAGSAASKNVHFLDDTANGFMNGDLGSSSLASNTPDNTQPKKVKFLSQPMPKGSVFGESANVNHHHPGIRKLKDKRFDSFKTWSGKLERQLSNLRGKPRESHVSEEDSTRSSSESSHVSNNVPVDRYFDALEGPELETLRASEEIVLPGDKTWPFLLRYPIASFGICLGVSSQAVMWKTLATASSTRFLHISTTINLILWCISVALVAIVSSIYLLKLIFYFEAVRREYYHPIRVNFFFAPFISLLFLALGVPPSVASHLHHSLWYILMTPFLFLELKIYGQWMSGGQRRLSKVANPSNHLSVVGNFVGALLGASMGLKEGPIFFFAVGLAHYIVLFVTLYQRLPTNETLPKELHPVFFLFVAAPSVASMAWANIQGSFDYGSRIAYFIALFLYFSLAVRINFFRGFKFSLAWWAYTFPMTGAAIATMRYSSAVTNVVTQTLSVILCVVSTLVVTALLVTTILHAFILRDLFPNDIAIAISYRKPKPHHKRWFHLRNGSSDHSKDIENFLKFADSADSKDIEAALKNPTTAEATSA
ncbi:C4-dicarboxylate transporter/malic acid transport protein [Corchorus olitorius]|uniref:C4-dicarboxylate transporter/malic acid transport protein n=1 Tax=Corchorus olitorius TaxID=93759 RepID=A0A1R3H9M2_9ROSI|nr:C4-dicarboxylate transporter/malic acid transport protein [Corchorus olitorius]